MDNDKVNGCDCRIFHDIVVLYVSTSSQTGIKQTEEKKKHRCTRNARRSEIFVES